MAIEDQPPASILLYLFADQVVAHDTAMTLGVTVPCTETKVQRYPLVTAITAVALWNLARHGLVTLQHQERKSLGLFTVRSVLVTPTGPGPTAGPLEGQFLALLARKGPHTAQRLVFAWFGRDVPDPAGRIVTRTRESAVPLGAFADVDVQQAPARRHRTAQRRLEPACARREELRPAGDRMLAQWQEFRSGHAQLAGQLETDLRKGIKSRRESND